MMNMFEKRGKDRAGYVGFPLDIKVILRVCDSSIELGHN
jgi:hypothetical protein